MSRVIVRDATYRRDTLQPIVFAMLEAMGGRAIGRGSRVLIKPNLISPATPNQAVLTHPAIVRAAVIYALDRGARPLVADSSAVGSFEKILHVSGIREALKGLDVECRPFVRSVRVEIGEPFGAIEIAEEAVQAEAIINLAKLKTHTQMLVTLAVKNCFGCIVGYRKPEWHMRIGIERQLFARLLARICLTLNPTFNLVDGILALEGNGPGRGGNPKELGILLAGNDPFAVDVAVCRMIGLDPLATPVLQAASALGWPLTEPACDGELPAIRGFKLPSLTSVVYGPKRLHGFFRRQLLRRPVCDEALCLMCGDCWKICPAASIAPEEKPLRFDYDRCIRCYCCVEVCPAGALTTAEPLAGRIVRRASAFILPGGDQG
jgi:uncharacterized protein (DUF362 family)/Pyruvate/2-oxoacid:ferredoxin oxidoreductase delta subunit